VTETQLGQADALGAAFARGEVDLRAVYEAHGTLVYAIACKAVGDDTAGEVTQEVFLSAWRAREQFDPARGTLAAWLVGITRRRIVDHVRRERRHRSRRADAEDATTRADLDAGLDRVTERMVLARALAALPDRWRTMIGLAYVHGLTHEQISARTGTALGTVKSDIRRGLLALRDEMGAAS
jgi:RNA polymerase sigma-70 factor (ECF subfamily)